MTRYARRVDANQAIIAEALVSAGWNVEYTFWAGKGIPDLVAYKDGKKINVWVETKVPGEKLTPAEKRFFETWGPGLKLVVYGPQDAVDKLADLEARQDATCKRCHWAGKCVVNYCGVK